MLSAAATISAGFRDARHAKLGARRKRSPVPEDPERSLTIATHIKTWAIAHVEGGLVSTQEIVNVITAFAGGDHLYQGFSELTGRVP